MGAAPLQRRSPEIWAACRWCLVLLGLYVGLYLTEQPGSATAAQTIAGTTQLYLGRCPAAALNDPHPTWVSYYSVNPTSGTGAT